MKSFLAFCLLAAALVAPCLAQTANPAASENTANQPTAAAEPMREDERIPFMAEDEKAGGNSSSTAPSAGGLIIRTLGALCLVGGLIFAGAWGLKKFGGYGFGKTEESAAGALSVVSSVTLGANRTLSVVRFGEKTLLVGSTAQSIALLATLDATAENAASRPAPRSVAEMLDDEEFTFEEDSKEEFSFGATLAAAEEKLLEGFRAQDRSEAL